MKPSSPIIPGADLPETVYAKDQPEYQPLPVYKQKDGTLLSRWHCTWWERLRILLTGDVYLWQATLNRPLQPVMLEARKPMKRRSIREWIRQRCHWQNLNEDRERKIKGSILRQGRAWFHSKLRDDNRRLPELRIEWSFWTNFWAIEFDVGAGDRDDGLSLWIAFGLISLHLTLEGILPDWYVERGRQKALGTKWMGYEYMAWPRKTGIRVFSNAVWFEIWNWDHGWSCEQPKWLSFNFNPVDFLLGCHVYSSEEIGVHELQLALPEASYPVTVKLTSDRWKRPRWPWPLVVKRAHMDCEHGIPIPGKGENSWDCGENRSFGLTTPAASAEEALEAYRVSVMETRQRYGGKDWRPEKVRV